MGRGCTLAAPASIGLSSDSKKAVHAVLPTESRRRIYGG